MEEVRHYIEDFAGFERSTGSDAPRLQRLRKEALAHFAKKGFPTFEDEEWRRTSVTPIAGTRFELPDGRTTLGAGQLKPHRLGGAELVFVNGRYAPERSTREGLPEGVVAGSLADALRERPELVEAHLARYARFRENPFVALNTAFLADGAFVQVPRETVVEAPIHLRFLSASDGRPTVSHPRNLLLVGEESQASFVENYAGAGTHLTNAVSELAVGERAVVEHARVQNESNQSFHIATLEVNQARESVFTSHAFSMGAALARADINVLLGAEGAECALNGLFVADGAQHADHHTRIDHAQPHGTSRELYKGILDGKATGVFDGKIIVRKDAQKTDARQLNKNLLLSGEAAIDTTPRLDILADDVKCSHGSTIGQLEEEALFYLRSRGIAREEARRLLIAAFTGEVTERVRSPALRRQVEELLAARLSGMQAIEARA